uniref:Ig-like domain-containing protein n=1 Tax=Amphilophus citrinellus TaxID=61819 RepID=A0A3Q0SDF2_AMPCI
MTSPMLAFYVTSLLLVQLAALNLSPSLNFKVVNAGQDVTLNCSFNLSTVAVMFYWYKQPLGQKPQLVSKFYKHDKNGTFSDEFKNEPRFELETVGRKNHLKISKVQTSDSATYYCISGYSYVYEFLEGIIIEVKDSSLVFQASVHQSTNEIIQSGGSVTLNCTVHTGTCDQEHSVYWFKNSEEFHPGLIYTHGGRNDQCEQNPTTQIQTCVYNLPMKSLNPSHAGTYYCAVASCGHILFGNGTELDIEGKWSSLVYVYVLGGALAFNSILLVFLAYAAYSMYKAKCCKCTVNVKPSKCSMRLLEAHYADHLHYAALKENKATRSRRQREDTVSECVYSSVKE